MYIEITIDLKHYTGDMFDIRLSNYHSVKKVIDIVWQAKRITLPNREGNWVRVANKHTVFSGNDRLIDCGITTGDRLEIL
ncbi:putative ubiquitin-like protein YukD [Oikeobacillus pervagus]|uniref:Ubiquitin-like protein YukD n=1 Tax=Oikeobacillus pervagus TaxID=1325931 RepID=A0AAJ1SZQ9_9BACI|nr:EsaB/YukD family protein [Oikeobacillus pervagus]MDQ0215839.1 putative ubiquitin-like protein YukD [Oikeobacillus pervagus]